MSTASEDDIEDSYGRLQDIIDTIPWGDVFLIMGDWNAKIGGKAVEGISGTHGLGDRNQAGERMIEFSEANQLIVTNTWYKQPRRRLYTWTSPDGLHRNQIDYILITKTLAKHGKISKNNARSWLWYRPWTACCDYTSQAEEDEKTWDRKQVQLYVTFLKGMR